MRILRDQTAAVMIDIQERLYPVMHNKEALLDRLVMLVKGLKLMNIPVVAAQQYTKGLGETVEPLKSLFSDFKIVEKICFSCCDEPKLMDEITALGKKFIIIAGIEAHVCVLQTVSDLLQRDIRRLLSQTAYLPGIHMTRKSPLKECVPKAQS